ncbi:MAG: aminopeptidase [Thermoplasmata archaeon]|nr:aminopeptidase [Thermoplasmata archaeon]
MIDGRWNQLANILINYSTQVKPGEHVLITMLEVETFPLVRALYAEAVKSEGLPFVEFQSMYLERDLMLYGKQEQLDWVPEMQSLGMEWADVYIGVRGARNLHEFSGIPSEKITAHRRVLGKVSSLRNQTRWSLIRVPNESFAQQAGISLDEMMDFFFRATLRDWSLETDRYRKIQEVFQAADQVRIIGRKTDISFSTKGRKYVIADGKLNMPDGEIFTCPVDDSAEGHIYFEFPGVYAGQIVEGIQLEFSKGEILSASAHSNGELLQKLIKMDDGANRLGEFGIGVNLGIDRFCYDILFDEKIGGTIHLALGRAFSECNGINQSALHWDIIKDLRQQGEIYLNGKRVFENGKFLFE